MTDEIRKAECQICHQSLPIDELVEATDVPPPVAGAIRQRYPDWSQDGYICFEDFHSFRLERLRQGIDLERKHLEKLDQFLKRSISQYEEQLQRVKSERDELSTLGERMADRLADVGGSWKFIFIFVGFLVVWIVINSIAFFTKPPDPYPYILLNLVLSCLAALQAPIIMMSQNRQEAKDRKRAEHDWQVDLKAELEIRHLNARVDFLVSHRWEHLIEMQEIQLDMMEHLRSGRQQEQRRRAGNDRRLPDGQ